MKPPASTRNWTRDDSHPYLRVGTDAAIAQGFHSGTVNATPLICADADYPFGPLVDLYVYDDLHSKGVFLDLTAKQAESLALQLLASAALVRAAIEGESE